MMLWRASSRRNSSGPVRLAVSRISINMKGRVATERKQNDCGGRLVPGLFRRLKVPTYLHRRGVGLNFISLSLSPAINASFFALVQRLI